MANHAFIGIDLGTSGCRAYAIDEGAQIIAQSRENANFTVVEQEPGAIWELVYAVLTRLIPQCKNYLIQSIAADATSGSILFTDSNGNAVTPLLMYHDMRSMEESQKIAEIAPENCAAHGANSGLAKIMYLQKKMRQNQSYHLMHQADWINFKLGAPLAITDENNALKSGYDPINRQWPRWLNQLIKTSVLPRVVAPGTPIGKLSKSLCQHFNLDYRPIIRAGTTDSIAAVLATGASKVGEAITSLGSTLVVKVISDKPVFITQQGVYSHRIHNKWIVGGASNTGGAVLKHFFTDEELNTLSKKIDLEASIPDYYPLLSQGERFPVYNPKFKGMITPRPDNDILFLYALLNGIANVEKLAYQILAQIGMTPIKSIRTVGGGAKNNTWQKIRKRKLSIPLINPEQTEAAYGTALIAKGHIV